MGFLSLPMCGWGIPVSPMHPPQPALPLPPGFLSQCLPSLAHPPISSPTGGLMETQDDCGPARVMLQEETGPPHGLMALECTRKLSTAPSLRALHLPTATP